MKRGSMVLLSMLVFPLLLAACAESDNGVTGPGGILTGTWRTAPVPSGAGTYLRLRQVGSSVTGNVWDYGIGPFSPLLDWGTGSGRCAGNAFDLQLRYLAAGTVRFAGELVGTDILEGTWTPPPPKVSFQISFFREPD